jgi:hypothetical protein
MKLNALLDDGTIFTLLTATRMQCSANKIAYFDSKLCKHHLPHASALPSNVRANAIVVQIFRWPYRE